MHIFSTFDELGRKDFLSGLLLWVVIMVVSFLLLPALGAIQPGERLSLWFALSLPLGIGGAFLLGSSSRFVAITNERSSSNSKTLLSLLGQFGGWIGLAGILFPFVMVTGEFFARLSAQ
jgi:cytochrome c oxidase assembly factor CtaG